ncbi:MAG: acyl carrier protein [Alphaproteobacteria bacterium]|nr:acyl carrier protein [Alphaproteobacteria bacterium]
MKEKFAGVFADVLRLSSEEIAADPKRLETEKWDSLQHMNLVAAIEQSFGIELSFDEIVEMQSFEKSWAIVEPKITQTVS